MSDGERWIIALLLVNLAGLAVLMLTVGELLGRSRPRVFYVHAGGSGGEAGEEDGPIPIRRPPDKPAA